jgi:hypothetical protein
MGCLLTFSSRCQVERFSTTAEMSMLALSGGDGPFDWIGIITIGRDTSDQPMIHRDITARSGYVKIQGS